MDSRTRVHPLLRHLRKDQAVCGPCGGSGGVHGRCGEAPGAAKHPERDTTPYAAFSMRKIPQAEGTAKTVPDKPAYPTFPRELPEDFRLWLEDEWCGVADLLTNDDAAELTGYAVTTVDNHIRAGRLKAVHTQDGLRIPKAWLVEFMCGHGYAIRVKSRRHCEMLGRYFAGGECYTTWGDDR